MENNRYTNQDILAPVVDRRSPLLFPHDDDLIELLRSTQFETRLQTLNRLSALVKRDPHWFNKLTRKGDLFKQFDRLLIDDRWEIQHQCIKFILDALPTFGSNAEWCISYLLPHIVLKLGSSKITVRRITDQMIITYLKFQPDAVISLQKMVVSCLLDRNNDFRLKSEILNGLPNLFVPECAKSSWLSLLSGLTHMMLFANKRIQEQIAIVIGELKVYISPERFFDMYEKLPQSQRKVCQMYYDFIWKTHEQSSTADGEVKPDDNLPVLRMPAVRYRFGIIPAHVVTCLSDRRQLESRITGLKEITTIVESIQSLEIRKFVPHLHSYFELLGKILDDSNFKVVVPCLKLLRLSIHKLNDHATLHYQQILSITSKHFGNHKTAIKQEINSICVILMEILSTKAIVAHLCLYLDHKNSRIREEILNIITVALLKFGAENLNLDAIAGVCASLLTDPKKRVRLAVFELFALLAKLLKNKIDVLVNCVRDIEVNSKAVGLLNSVMIRISRNVFPKIRPDGLIEYSMPVSPDFYLNRISESTKTDNADCEWILNPRTSGESSSLKSGSPDVCEHEYNYQSWVNSHPGSDKLDHLVQIHDGKNTKKFRWGTGSDETEVSTSALSMSQCSKNFGDGNSSLYSEDKQKNNMHEEIGRAKQNRSSPFKNGGGSINRNACSNSADLFLYKSTDDFKSASNGRINKCCRKSASVEEELLKNGSAPPLCNKSDYHAPIESNLNFMPSVLPAEKSLSQQNLAANPKRLRHLPKSIIAVQKGKAFGSVKSSSIRSTSPFVQSHDMKSSHGSTSMLKLRKRTNFEIVEQNPESALQAALDKVAHEDWKDKVEAIEIIAYVLEIAPTVCANKSNAVIGSLLNECRNLRSTVARAAIVGIGKIFSSLKADVDFDIDKICLTLMQKAGDVSSAFIRDDAYASLEELVKNAPPAKVLSGLRTSGFESKNNSIRASCASLLVKLLERIGPANVPNCLNLAKVISAFVAFAKDPNPSVRYQGKHGLQLMHQSIDKFEKMLHKTVTESEMKTIHNIVNSIQKRGLDASNLDSCSSLGLVSRSSSFRQSARHRLNRISDSTQTDFNQICEDLTANEWERRSIGLKRFYEAVTRSRCANISSDTRLLEAFVGRLNDINGKIALEAMRTYLMILPMLSKSLSMDSGWRSILNPLIHALMSNLSSCNDEHRKLGKKCINETIENVDKLALSSAFSAASRQSNVKQKPFMLQSMSVINKKLYKSKPRQVELTSLPVLWDLIKSPVNIQRDLALRHAAKEFAIVLKDCIGGANLLHIATSHLSPSQKVSLELLMK